MFRGPIWKSLTFEGFFVVCLIMLPRPGRLAYADKSRLGMQMGEISESRDSELTVETAGELVPGQPVIPDKLFFRIGEVSQLVGVEAYVLRYWETEFPGLSPRKSSSGQRMFRRKDVELLLRIKDLLYGQKFTIEGARKVLLEKSKAKPLDVRKVTVSKQTELFSSSPLPEIRKQVSEILRLLS